MAFAALKVVQTHKVALPCFFLTDRSKCLAHFHTTAEKSKFAALCKACEKTWCPLYQKSIVLSGRCTDTAHCLLSVNKEQTALLLPPTTRFLPFNKTLICEMLKTMDENVELAVATILENFMPIVVVTASPLLCLLVAEAVPDVSAQMPSYSVLLLYSAIIISVVSALDCGFCEEVMAVVNLLLAADKASDDEKRKEIATQIAEFKEGDVKQAHEVYTFNTGMSAAMTDKRKKMEAFYRIVAREDLAHAPQSRFERLAVEILHMFETLLCKIAGIEHLFDTLKTRYLPIVDCPTKQIDDYATGFAKLLEATKPGCATDVTTAHKFNTRVIARAYGAIHVKK
jgi:hypothetical protein